MATPEPGADANAAAEPARTAPAARPGSPTGAFLGRLMVVHFVAWAVGFGSAVAQMPIAIWARQKEILHAGPTGATVGLVRNAARNLALSPTEAAQLQIVLDFIVWGGFTVLIAVHLAGLPWCIASARATRRPELAPVAAKRLRTFGRACATIGVVIVLAGVAGWVWLYTL